MSATRRIGKFTCPLEWATDYRSDLLRVLGKCAVLRAEVLFHEDQIEYVAICDHFRAVPHGSVIPDYFWAFDADGMPSCEEIPF